MFCPGDELTPLPRPGRVCSHGAAVTGRAQGRRGTRNRPAAAIPWHGEKEVPPRATPPHHFLSGAGFWTDERGDRGAAGPSEAGGCARRAEGSAGGRRRGDTAGNCAAIGSPVLLPIPQGSPRHPEATSSFIPATASCSSPLAPFRQKPPLFSRDAPGSSPPLAVLPFGLGLRAWQNLGLGWWGLVANRLSWGMGGRRWWLSPLSPCVVCSGRVSACSGREPKRLARLLPSRGPRAAAARDARALLASADIPGFTSQP